MVHQLFIFVDYKKPKEFELNEIAELPSNVNIQLNFHAKNIGDEDFPGGKLKEVTADYGVGGGLVSWYAPNKKIEAIPKGETQKIYTWPNSFAIPGLVWLKCKIISQDEQPIEFFQLAEKTNVLKDQWENAYFVVDSQSLRIIGLLKEMDKKLGMIVKKEI